MTGFIELGEGKDASKAGDEIHIRQNENYVILRLIEAEKLKSWLNEFL